jgi:hypothetical protein
MTEPAHEGTCTKCDRQYTVWHFDEYGTQYLCPVCDEHKQSLDTAYFPSFHKPVTDRESEIISVICSEMSCDVWETDHRVFVYNPH